MGSAPDPELELAGRDEVAFIMDVRHLSLTEVAVASCQARPIRTESRDGVHGRPANGVNTVEADLSSYFGLLQQTLLDPQLRCQNSACQEPPRETSDAVLTLPGGGGKKIGASDQK